MRRTARTAVLAAVLLGLIGAAGCQSTGLRFLSLIGIQKDPLIVSLVADQGASKPSGPLAVLNPFGAYDKLTAVLRDELGRPVGWDLCFKVQLASSLDLGLCHLAVVSPVTYARLADRERYPVVAVPVDEDGQVARCALLVVAAGSEIEAVEDLRGKTVAFGPSGDSLTHYAALELLEQHGLEKTDLSLEIVPLPGSLKHMPDARSVAQTVMNASSDAGFMDEAGWAALPEHTDEEGEPARDRLKVIGRTIALPQRLIISSPKLDEATRDKVRSVLLAVKSEHSEAAEPLGISGYEAPTEELLNTCARLGETPAPKE